MSKAKRTKRNIQCDLFLAEAEALTLRDVAEGQAELQVRTTYGMFTIRFVARRHYALRFTDLRARDRKTRRASTLISVPFAELTKADAS